MGGGFILLRLVHVSLGVFWAGGVLFMNFVVGPALAATGQDGMKVMAELNRRRYFDLMIVAGTLTLLSGFDMMRRDGFLGSGQPQALGRVGFTAGMVSALIAYVIALVAIRPTLKRMSGIGGRMAQAGPDGQAALMAEMLQVRGRLIAFGSIGALFLLIAVMAMAVARYL